MEIKQQLRMSQQLVMTPQLQQAIKLLQMSRMELVDLVREEMLENPLLEDQVETGETAEARNGKGTEAERGEGNGQGDERSIDQAVAADHKSVAEEARKEEKKTDEIDWERYLENHSLQAPMPSVRGGGDSDELPGVDATLTRRDDLVDHLAFQIRMSDFVEDEIRFAALVLGNLDDDGLLTLYDLVDDAGEAAGPVVAPGAEGRPDDAEDDVETDAGADLGAEAPELAPDDQEAPAPTSAAVELAAPGREADAAARDAAPGRPAGEGLDGAVVTVAVPGGTVRRRLVRVPPEDVVPRLAAEAGLDPEDAEEVLKIIQRMDPVGVASRDLAECLRVQAEAEGMEERVLLVIDEHLQDLEQHNYARIEKALDVSREELSEIVQDIQSLDPRPGRNFTGNATQYITPDVYVYKRGDEYEVEPNDDGMPRLKISGFYRAAMAEDPKAKEYIQGKLRSAQWLIRSIDQRQRTIEKVTKCIVEKQRDFFDMGIEHLKPMILRDVAEAVEMHESTISRVTSKKYVHTPRGLFELKYFFNSAIRRDNQDDIASESVKRAIAEIIAGEDGKAPYSDQKIVQILSADRGIKIARRTVAKYREMMGILSSSKRKQYF